ncbi:cell division protein ZapE [Litoreibacter roseus]|uniref:Cell division protein ZapE n=2 Tax=Litoreibacter roseus TaxID=2601869 RepID=A0A6N6JDS8_9RHOB|nr:cell division protein ZapE [Litoreibacter roseus]
MVADGQLTADVAQREALPLLEDVRAQLAEAPKKSGFLGRFGAKPEPVKGLYLWGGVGRGKSMLMDLFFDHADITAKRRVHFHAFMQEVHNALHEARKTGTDDAIQPVAKDIASDLRLLCFDEMQITDITDAMIVGRLFEQLFKAGVAVVTTSNRVPEDLYKDGLNRDLFLPFISLLEDHLVVHELASHVDYRQDRLAGEQVYFTPANAEARGKIDALWDSLTGGTSQPLHLNVKGRVVEIPAFHNGAARATFFDLCGKPLGPADYLALAAAVKVLVLENIPALSRSNFNPAKRFVTLIDALYEARVRLICSAADVPERLYLEGEGAFEFERTASRLREMQADGWGEALD